MEEEPREHKEHSDSNDNEHKEHSTHHAPKHHAREHETHSRPHKQEQRNWLQIASIIQILLLVFIAFQINGLDSGVVANEAQGEAPSRAAPSARPAAPTPTVDMEELIDDDSVKGDANAPVTIVEFSDYECPFCARFYSSTLAQLDEKYIKTGKVKLIYRDFPLSFHPNANSAAEAAECAGEQGKYYEMHDKLFDNYQSLSASNYKKWAGEIGLSMAQFNNCFDSGKMKGEVLKDFNDGQRAGVQGTPAFFVNGKSVSGAQPFQVFEQLIEAELAG